MAVERRGGPFGTVNVSYDDTPEMHKAAFDRLLRWFHTHQCYSGESIMQSDAPQITAAEMLSEIADDVIKFETEWDDD